MTKASALLYLDPCITVKLYAMLSQEFSRLYVSYGLA